MAAAGETGARTPTDSVRPPPTTSTTIQASLLRTLASPHRLRIIHRLGVAPCEVNELARDLGLSQATTSQHLAAMRAAGLVEAVRDGRTVRYQLADPEILAACGLMRSVLVRRLSRLGDLRRGGRPSRPSRRHHRRPAR